MKDEGIKGIVKALLINDREARNYFSHLYLEVCKVTNPDLINKPFSEVYNKLPNPETVRRSRQDIQMRNPELRSDDDVQAFKDIKEEEYRKYYGSRWHT